MTETPTRRAGHGARSGAIAAACGFVLVMGAVPAPAQPAAGLSRAACVTKAQKKRMAKGMRKRAVRRMIGTRGAKVRRSSRVEVRRFLGCGGGRYVLVKYRKGRVVSVKTRAVSKALPTADPAASRLVPSDIDGNGTTDYWFDADSDGHYEIAILDTDGNGFFESYFVEGRTIQGVFTDRNENGYIEAAAFDSDKDGNANWMVYDQDEDGVADYTAVDLVGSDGIADTWVPANSPTSYNPPNVTSQQAREADDMMVRHIVTMNQLRQFDPWSPAYVPDGLTPSLLLP